MTNHLLLMAGNLENHLGLLTETCVVHRYYNSSDREGLIAEDGQNIRVVATNGHVGCSAELMDRLPNLELIGCFGVGYDGIDIAAAKKRGIRVTNTPDVLNDAVAEMTLGLMLALGRRIPQSDQYIRNGNWTNGDYPLTTELTGKTVGILGMGRIGKEIASRLQAMKMRVVYHGRNEQPHQPFQYYSDLVEMASHVDWLVVSLPGGASTDHIVNADVLSALGNTGYLVNVARGSVVDQESLCRAIVQGGIAGAALDVFAEEPSVPQVLIDSDNVVLTPHAASATDKTRRGMGDLVIHNILAHLNNEPLLTQVV